MSKAYMIAFVEVKDFEAFKQNYIIPSGPLVAKHGGTLLAASPQVVVKEEPIPPGFGILVEFPSMENLEAFYTDPDYAPLIEFRKTQGASSLAYLPQGGPPSP